MAQKKQKKLAGNIKFRVAAGKATAAPPVGSIMGQWGLNMQDFINPFNDQTKHMMGQTVGVKVKVYDDRSFTFTVSGAPTDEMIRAALGIQKGSGKPHSDKVGTITKSQLEEIAKQKMELSTLNANDLEAATKVVAGTARSMGVDVNWDK
jgi:large subunit ribosomal protein L11